MGERINRDKICRLINRSYLLLSGIRNFFYDWGVFRTVQLDIPIISVGNISWGGTGKTELIKTIARKLLARGKNVLVVARGYKCNRPVPREIFVSDWDCDEMSMLKKSLPGLKTFIGPKREDVICLARNKYPTIDVVLLDDGFQYRRLRRDLDIVLVREKQKYLREGERSLKRAGLIVISKISDLETAKRLSHRLSGYAPVVGTMYKVSLPEWVKEADLVCGVADPNSVFNSVQRIGVDIRRVFPFPDHYRYSSWSVRSLIRKTGDVIVCTPKDWVKLARFKSWFEENGKRVVVLSVEVEFLWGEEIFWNKINEVIKWTPYGEI